MIFFFENMYCNYRGYDKQCNKYKIYLLNSKKFNVLSMIDFYEIKDLIDEDDKNKIRNDFNQYMVNYNNQGSVVWTFRECDESFWNWLIYDMSINIIQSDVEKCNSLLNEHKNKIIKVILKNKLNVL